MRPVPKLNSSALRYHFTTTIFTDSHLARCRFLPQAINECKFHISTFHSVPTIVRKFSSETREQSRRDEIRFQILSRKFGSWGIVVLSSIRPDLPSVIKSSTPPHRLRSRYFRPPGTLCREVSGACFAFSGIASTVFGGGLATGRPVLRFVFFLFVVMAFPRLG